MKKLLIIALALLLAACAGKAPVTDAPVEAPPPRVLNSPAPPPIDLAVLEYALGFPITVRLAWSELNPGDLNGDGVVSGLDVFPIAVGFGSHPGDAAWDECADANGDDVVSGLDLFQVAASFQHRVDEYRIWHGIADNFTELTAAARPTEFDTCLPAYDVTHQATLIGNSFQVAAWDAVTEELGEFSETAIAGGGAGHDGHYDGTLDSPVPIVEGVMSFDVATNVVTGTVTITAFFQDYEAGMPGLVTGDTVQGVLTVEDPENPEGPPLPIGQYEGTFDGEGGVAGTWSVTLGENEISGDWEAQKTS